MAAGATDLGFQRVELDLQRVEALELGVGLRDPLAQAVDGPSQLAGLVVAAVAACTGPVIGLGVQGGKTSDGVVEAFAE